MTRYTKNLNIIVAFNLFSNQLKWQKIKNGKFEQNKINNCVFFLKSFLKKVTKVVLLFPVKKISFYVARFLQYRLKL